MGLHQITQIAVRKPREAVRKTGFVVESFAAVDHQRSDRRITLRDARVRVECQRDINRYSEPRKLAIFVRTGWSAAEEVHPFRPAPIIIYIVIQRPGHIVYQRVRHSRVLHIVSGPFRKPWSSAGRPATYNISHPAAKTNRVCGKGSSSAHTFVLQLDPPTDGMYAGIKQKRTQVGPGTRSHGLVDHESG